MTRYLIDARREMEVAGDKNATIRFAINHFIECAQNAIQERGLFTVALSGGSTPRAIFEGLSSPEYRNKIDWQRVALFWSDERCVGPDDPESNYHMAMEAGLGQLAIPPAHIHRMVGEATDLIKTAEDYQKQMMATLSAQKFDLVMLGMGDDGHTASLFPHTKALQIRDKLVAANYIPSKECWRLTLTFSGIEASRHIAIYVIGKTKAPMLHKVLRGPYNPDELPAQAVGTASNKALWIADNDAADQFPITTESVRSLRGLR